MSSIRSLLAAGLVLFFLHVPVAAIAADAAPALTGTVSSAEEGAMEGVLVSAKKSGSNITITVVSDAQGRYRFPASKLEPGQYAVRIRAIGYDLDGRVNADIAAQKTVTAASEKLNGTTWVITGTLSEDRETIADTIRANGGKVSGSVSGKTTYLLAGEDAGSKLDKATKLGVKIVTEAEFRGML